MANLSNHFQHQIPLAKLEPSIHTDSSSITGIVALIWPYSSANGAFSFLLAEPDFRLRRQKGQVLVRLYGSSAKAIARSGIINGDQVRLSLTGVTWIKDDSTLKIPGKGIDWDLQFRERVVIQVSHPAQEPICLDIDHPAISPEPEIQPQNSPPSSTSSLFVPRTTRPDQTREPQSWSSPAFLKRSHLPYATYFNSKFDPFQDDEKFADNGRNKKLKFGRKSDQWVFADSSPASEKELEIEDPESGRATSPISAEATNRVTPPIEALKFDPLKLDEAIGYLPSNGETKIFLDMDQVMGRYTIDEGTNINLTSSDGSNKPSSPSQSRHPEDSVIEDDVGLDSANLRTETILNNETSPEAVGSTTVQEPPILKISAGGDVTKVELPTTTLSGSPKSFGAERSIPKSTVQEKLTFCENETIHSEATGFDQFAITSNEETRPSTLQLHPYSLETLEANRAFLNSELTPSASKSPVTSEVGKESDQEFNSLSHISSSPSESATLTSSQEDPPSSPADFSSDDNEFDFGIDMPSERMPDFFMSESTEGFSDTESEDAASDGSVEESSDPDNTEEYTSDGSVEESPSPGATEKYLDSRPPAGNQKQMITSPIFDRARSSDDLTREVPDDSSLGLDGSSYSRSVSVPLNPHFSNSKTNLAKAGEGSAPVSKNRLVRLDEKKYETFAAEKGVNNSKPFFQSRHEVTNATKNEKSFEMEVEEKSTLIPEDLEIRDPINPNRPDTERYNNTDESTKGTSGQLESNLDEKNINQEVKDSIPNEFQGQHQLDIRDNSRHAIKQTDMEVAIEARELRIDDQSNKDEDFVDLPNPNQQIERSEDSQKSSVDEGRISEEDQFIRRSFEIPSQDESDISNEEIRDKHEPAPLIKESTIEVINLESDDEDDTPACPKIKKDPEPASNESVTIDQSHNEDIISTSKIVEQSLLRSVLPDAPNEMSNHVSSDLEDIASKSGSNQTEATTMLLPSTFPETLPVDSDRDRVDQSSVPNDFVSETQITQSQVQNSIIELRLSTSVVERKVLDDKEADPRLRRQLLTPNYSQQTSLLSEQSALSHIEQDDHDLPSPALTQSTSAPPLPPRTPNRPHKPTLIEKLKAMRSLSAKTTRTRTSTNTFNPVSPWFAQKEISQITHVSDSEGDVESQSIDNDLIRHGGDQERDQAKSLWSDSSVQPEAEEVDSANTIENTPTGFRTSHSYFAPLATLSSHYNTQIDVLAIILAATPITRAKSGPLDYNQTLSITDPSLVSSPNPIINTQIFRPNQMVFPSVTQGDSILLRNFKTQSFQNALGLLSTDDSAWAVFRKDAEVQVTGPPVEFGAEERGFARGLWGWWGSLGAAKKTEFDNILEERSRASNREEDGSEQQEQPNEENDSPKKPLPRRQKGKKRSRGRPSRGEGVVRHELRDGASYTDGRIERKGVVHELRDGTTWSDVVDPF